MSITDAVILTVCLPPELGNVNAMQVCELLHQLEQRRVLQALLTTAVMVLRLVTVAGTLQVAAVFLHKVLQTVTVRR